MSGGGGGGGDNLLNTAIMVGAAVAAPEIAPLMFEGGALAGSTALATGAAGALTGGVGGMLTGQDPVRSALIGGAGGALTGALAPGADIPGVSTDTSLANYANATSDPIGALSDSGALSGGAGNGINQLSSPNVFGQTSVGGAMAPSNLQLGASGVTGLLSAQNLQTKYGVPTQSQLIGDTGPLGKYNPYSAKGVQYPTSYANGGMVPMVAQYPQQQVTTNRFANASQTPMSTSPLRMASGGISDLGSYSDGGRMLEGPGDGMSDDIPASIGGHQPARLADGEFVVPADVVSHLGNGSTDAGAKQLYSMMDKVRQARTGVKRQGKQINPKKYLPV